MDGLKYLLLCLLSSDSEQPWASGNGLPLSLINTVEGDQPGCCVLETGGGKVAHCRLQV